MTMARVALLGLDAGEEARWRVSAEKLSAECSVVFASGECAAYAGAPVPLVVVAQAGPRLEPRLVDSSDSILGPVPLIVVCTDHRELTLWGAVAWDALLMPLTAEKVEPALDDAIVEARRRMADSQLVAEFRRRHASLNENELPVFRAVCAGRLNKQIAGELNVSVRTIEQRRRRVFEKMNVESAVPLAAMAATVRTLSSQSRHSRRQTPLGQIRDDEPVRIPRRPNIAPQFLRDTSTNDLTVPSP